MFNTIDFKIRSLKRELLDDEELDAHQINQNLKEFIYLNKFLGVKSTLINSLQKISSRYKSDFENNMIRIADLGCGAGDLLIAMHHWANTHNFKTALTGVDCNPITVGFAKTKTQNYSNIMIQESNIFSDEFNEKIFDIICLNNICHHFTNEQLIQLLKRLSLQTKYAIIINDLRRDKVAYYAIKWLTRLFNLSFYAQHDGPLSVLKAFKQTELEECLLLSNNLNFEMSRVFPFRFQLIIWL